MLEYQVIIKKVKFVCERVMGWGKLHGNANFDYKTIFNRRDEPSHAVHQVIQAPINIQELG